MHGHGKQYKAKPCEECHVEHIGRGTKLIRWPGGAMDKLDHKLTGWPLEGAHVGPKCLDCHKKTSPLGKPQFVATDRGSAFWQFIILGAIVAALDVIYELILVWAAGALRGRVLGSRRFAQWRRRITGAALIGLGARLAWAQRQ